MTDEQRMNIAALDPADLDRVAVAALAHIDSGMLLGLGSGRTSEAFIRRLGERVRGGLQIQGVATSERSAALARRENIPILPFEEVERLDVAVDGADEVAPDLGLIKGLGGALLRERVVAYEAARFIILVTPEKLVEKLGSRVPVPIEVVPFASASAARHLAALGGKPAIRKNADGYPFQTDNHNWILDTAFGPIDAPAALDARIRKIPGVMDTGLFLDMATLVLVAEAGAVRELRRQR
ncbi:ribose 5-phosphate isomerase A [Sorangium cellulosum]|uniref:Ribose-5-phosphate isomerase A n=2 Tax=Sorangium TaxID=39643 RepID=A0A150R6X0_SORCE|nr:ribose 5-phosphate isomerase A [Sorangium cellulosum]KYF99820.1 ribose 5-phosphate isomerase A [Sorangium cellulosum]KYG06381.1 ribose 5-phosphate isomerase A [Sorangium cellulosum]